MTYWHAHKKVRVEMQAAISVGISSTHEAVASIAKSSEPSRNLQRIVASFNGDRHLQATWIGPTGAPIAESRVLGPSDDVPDWFYRIFAGEPYVADVTLPPKLADLGHIRLATDSHNETEEIWEDLALKSLIVSIFTCLLMSLVHAALGNALKPLERLSAALGSVGRGDYSTQVPETGPRELASIYGEFNRMAGMLNESENQNRRLNDQLSRVQEEERADIARDLHDEFGPFLFSVDVDARSIREAADGGKAEISRSADDIRSSVAHMQKHLRSILGRLRPSALLDLGLAPALDHLVGFWRSRQPGIAFSLSVDRQSFGMREDDTCYRVVQESISNAVRHGKSTAIDISVHSDEAGSIHVRVRDNGSGLNVSGTKGFGLVGMRERVAALRGQVTVEGDPGGTGVLVYAVLPKGDGDVHAPPRPAGLEASHWGDVREGAAQ